jgi:ornithine cyclodeaminase/alanine dehydrogenase-like protein (mu-crystallin family)
VARRNETRILTRSEIASMLNLDDYMEGVEYAFRAHGQGKSFGTAMVHGDTPGELEFHIKAGGLTWHDQKYYGLKINGSCFNNKELRGLPNILGAILLFDGESGFPLAVIDSGEPTIKRTAAGTAVAMKYLAAPDVKVMTVCGCGNQGRIHVQFLRTIRPIAKVFAYDQNPEIAKAFAHDLERESDISIQPAQDLASAVAQSRLVVTCTPSKTPFLYKEYVMPGTTVAAVGSDNPEKQELDARLLKGNKVVVDILSQCAQAGELHHALNQRLLKVSDVYAEIGEIVSGKKPGRTSPAEIIVYDATGTALQDTAAAALCYEKALARNIGRSVNLLD